MSARTEFETETNIPAAKPIMLAARIHEFGGPEALRLEEAPTPEPNAGEVRIRVRASAVNPADYKMRGGMMGNLPLPFTLGLDFSGEVEAVGSEVSNVKVGDRVGYATGPLGAYSEQHTLPAASVVKLPDAITFEQAAPIIVEKRAAKEERTIKVFEKEKIQLLRGPYGPYIKQGLRNYKLPKEKQDTAADLSLEEVKAIGRALNCSINDVLLSCVAGAIGGYLRGQGDDPTGQEIRAMIPVNLRPMEEAWKLGNRFGRVPLVLPIGVANPIERVHEVRRRMNALKGSTQPILAFAMLAAAGLMIKPAQDALLNLFGRKTTAVMTNVPGPREQLTLCGARVTQCMFWVPQSGDIGLGVSILSYGGGVQFGVITDTTLCPEPQQIIDAFAPEFAQLSLLTLMLPWGE